MWLTMLKLQWNRQSAPPERSSSEVFLDFDPVCPEWPGWRDPEQPEHPPKEWVADRADEASRHPHGQVPRDK